jgi:hypothetical protein
MLAGALVSTAAAHAATYYVATTGSNSNPGTESKPWRTIAKAVATMVAGDTTYVRGGTYDEGQIRFRRSGTQAAPIKLLNYPGETPIISFISNIEVHGILIENGTGMRFSIGWITIQGFEIRDGYFGIKFYNLHNSVIRNNWVHDNRTQGILGGGGHDNVFDRNIINHNGDFAACARSGTKTACTLEHGIYAHGDTYVLTNNLIYDNLAYGIQHNGSSSSSYSSTKHPGPEFAGANNWIIANNTFAYNVNRSGIVVWGNQTSGTRIENNIFYENGTALAGSSVQGINFASCCGTGIQIRNNHFYASGSGGTVPIASNAIEGIHYTQSGNSINVSNPGFVNAPATLPASPNFALTARSPAIDAGLALKLDWTDIDLKDTPRPQGPAPDIGAYEYRANGDSHTPNQVHLNRR